MRRPKTPFKHGQGECVFCGKQGNMSREHLWPKWFRNYVPRIDRHLSRVNHATTLNWPTAQGGVATAIWPKGKLARPGELADQTLKVVCKTCNETWMSRLQSEVKGILVPLIKGDWTSPVEEKSAMIMARWAAMFTMVLEFADKKTVAISQEERTALYLHNRLPEGWRVWIGRNSGKPANFWHRGACLLEALPSTNSFPKCNTQISTMAFGKLLLQTFSSRSPVHNRYHDEFAAYMSEYGRDWGLCPVWPHIGVSVGTPEKEISDLAFQDVSTSLFDEIIQIDPVWHGKRLWPPG